MGQKNHGKQQQWHPISAMPMIAYALAGQVESVDEQLQNLSEAIPKPHVLDNETLDRIIHL